MYPSIHGSEMLSFTHISLYVIPLLDCAFNVKRRSQKCNNLKLRSAILELPAWTNAAYLS